MVRRFLKSIVWRVIATTVTVLITMLVTGSVDLAFKVGLADTVIKIIAFMGFDFGWNKMVDRRVDPCVVWLTGLSGSGKTTIALEMKEQLERNGQSVMILDGDELRTLFPGTGFSKDDRIAHNVRTGQLASYLESQGVIAIIAIIGPYAEGREKVRGLCKKFIEVHIATCLDHCERRDVKGLYKKARSGEIKNFTGISDPYEEPSNPELRVHTLKTVRESTRPILKRMKE